MSKEIVFKDFKSKIITNIINTIEYENKQIGVIILLDNDKFYLSLKNSKFCWMQNLLKEEYSDSSFDIEDLKQWFVEVFNDCKNSF